MDFTPFDSRKLDEYAKQAKQSWGHTAEYREFAQKNANRTQNENKSLGNQLMAIISEFGAMQDMDVTDPAVVTQVRKVQEFITEHYYKCSDTILAQLGQMYGAGGEFTANINAVGGPGAAEFASKAIGAYCENITE